MVAPLAEAVLPRPPVVAMATPGRTEAPNIQKVNSLQDEAQSLLAPLAAAPAGAVRRSRSPSSSPTPRDAPPQDLEATPEAAATPEVATLDHSACDGTPPWKRRRRASSAPGVPSNDTPQMQPRPPQSAPGVPPNDMLQKQPRLLQSVLHGARGSSGSGGSGGSGGGVSSNGAKGVASSKDWQPSSTEPTAATPRRAVFPPSYPPSTELLPAGGRAMPGGALPGDAAAGGSIAGGAISSTAPIRVPEAQQPEVPLCSGCGGLMEWRSDCFRWECVHQDTCQSTHFNMGTQRWYCKRCSKNICGQCCKKVQKEKFAFVAVIFGRDPKYCVEAAVLGWSLKQVGAQHPYVLLHTGDVPSRYLRILKDDVGWELKMVNKITDGDVLCKNLRFMGVFTKFHALSLTEYDKIVMLDVDLLVRRNVDHLFERHAPTATRRGSPGNHEDDAPIPDQCGINAGVMILRPSNNVFKRILADLKEKKKKDKLKSVPPEPKSCMPEQDYLSRWYAGDWRHLAIDYNFQIHQLGFTDRFGEETCRRITQNVDQVSIAHFSAIPKPRDLLFKPGRPVCRSPTPREVEKYAKDTLAEVYWKSHDRDWRPGGRGGITDEIKKKLTVATVQFTLEWFKAWKALAEAQPGVWDLVVSQPLLALSGEAERNHSSHGKRGGIGRFAGRVASRAVAPKGKVTAAAPRREERLPIGMARRRRFEQRRRARSGAGSRSQAARPVACAASEAARKEVSTSPFLPVSRSPTEVAPRCDSPFRSLAGSPTWSPFAPRPPSAFGPAPRIATCAGTELELYGLCGGVCRKYQETPKALSEIFEESRVEAASGSPSLPGSSTPGSPAGAGLFGDAPLGGALASETSEGWHDGWQEDGYLRKPAIVTPQVTWGDERGVEDLHEFGSAGAAGVVENSEGMAPVAHEAPAPEAQGGSPAVVHTGCWPIGSSRYRALHMLDERAGSIVQLGYFDVSRSSLPVKKHVGAPVETKFYDILKITPEATSDEIRRAFLWLGRKHYPGNLDSEDSGNAAGLVDWAAGLVDYRRFQELARVYWVLIDTEQRKNYDVVGEAGIDVGAWTLNAKHVFWMAQDAAVSNEMALENGILALEEGDCGGTPPPSSPAGAMLTGTLKKWQNFWGFIVSDSFAGDLFAHKDNFTTCPAGFDSDLQGCVVQFRQSADRRGRPQAVDIALLPALGAGIPKGSSPRGVAVPRGPAVARGLIAPRGGSASVIGSAGGARGGGCGVPRSSCAGGGAGSVRSIRAQKGSAYGEVVANDWQKRFGDAMARPPAMPPPPWLLRRQPRSRARGASTETRSVGFIA